MQALRRNAKVSGDTEVVSEQSFDRATRSPCYIDARLTPFLKRVRVAQLCATGCIQVFESSFLRWRAICGPPERACGAGHGKFWILDAVLERLGVQVGTKRIVFESSTGRIETTQV